jgi:DNA-binding NarL/FixJ family response regulator
VSVRVLVVDDHPLYREGLVAAISTMPGMEIVGEAGDGEEAVTRVAELRPDVVVMDLHMPRLNGVQATRAVTEQHPEVAVLVLTMLENDESVFAAVRAGARGYLLKGADRAEIARALDAVAHGEVMFSSAIAARVMSYFAADRTGVAVTPFPELTDREREVLAMVARGLTNAAIARELVVSDKTVRNHVSNIFAKLHVAGRAEAVARARDAGLGS